MANSEFTINVTQFLEELKGETTLLGERAKAGMNAVLEQWVLTSRDLAPLKTGNLRGSIHPGEITGEGLNLTGYVTANAVREGKDGDFNYAYYIHEQYPNPQFKNPSVEGTVPKFFDQALEQNEAAWIALIEKYLATAIGGAK